jgi:hypothetical protein
MQMKESTDDEIHVGRYLVRSVVIKTGIDSSNSHERSNIYSTQTNLYK